MKEIDTMFNLTEDDGPCGGDARRCRVHPWVAMSSSDGMHDAPCGACEAAMDEASAQDETGPFYEAKAPSAEILAYREQLATLARIKAGSDEDIPF